MEIPWPLIVAWLWLTKPRWMLRHRKRAAEYREHGVPVPPHTFGDPQ